MFSRYYLILLMLCQGTLLLAQPSNDNCSNALSLCPGISFASTTQAATTEECAGCADDSTVSAALLCFDPDNTVWFSFTTNTTGGSASVTLSNISCLTGTGNDNELQGVILEAATACNASTATSVSNCEPNATGGFTLSATGLNPLTTYYVVIDGDLNGAGVVNAASCSFSINVTGSAVEWDVQTTIISQTCGNTDGEIQIISSSGGTSPYEFSINGGAFQTSTTFSGLTAGTYIIRMQDNSGCIQIVDTAVVDLTGGPENGTANTTPANCNNPTGSIEIVNVSGGTLPYTYALNGGTPQSGTTFSNLVAGTYNVTVTDSQGCTQELTNIVVSNSTGPTSGTPIIDHPTCGNGDGELTFTISNGTLPLFYSLNGGPSQSSNLYTNLSPGSYSVLITDANGCTFEINNIELIEQPGTLVTTVSITGSPNPSCVGDNVSYTATTTNGGTAPQLEWFVNGASMQTGGTTFSSSTLSDGDVVSATIISNEPCIAVTSASSNQISQTVVPVNNPTVTITSSATSACSNEPVTFTATPSGCTSSADYQWNINGSTTGSGTDTSFTTTLASTSAVSVTMTCSDACSVPATSNTVNVTITQIEADAGPDQVIFVDGTAQLQGTGGGTYSWQPASSLSNPNVAGPIASPGGTTTYFLTVSLNGCTDTDEMTVFVIYPIGVPNTFTPNGDGINDIWSINRIDQYPNCKVTVYDRWGQRVFNSIGYSDENAWDGTFHGAYLPAATYYYVIDLNSGVSAGSDNYAGSITIIY
jgi:large repetitive protein